jgi:signal transduction histidine kinase
MFLLYSTGFTAFAIVLISFIYSYLEIKDFEKDAERDKIEFIKKQQEVIRFETEKAVDHVNLTRMFIEDNMQEELITKVNTAWDICSNVYSENIKTHPKHILKKAIKDALRPIRFFNDRGYYFIVSMDGTEELFPVSPELEGKNLLNLQDEKENYVIRDEIEIIKKYGEGFVTDYWSKPGSDSKMIYPKTSFIKYFEPLNWYIGCGEYLDNFQQDIQQQVLQRLSSIRFGKNGYIFINTYDGIALLMDGEIKKEAVSVWELEDPKGVKVIQEERKAVDNPNGDFIDYSWRKLKSNKVFPKTSFVKGVPEWEWMVGSGVYIDEIDSEIALQRNLLYNHLKKRVLTSLLVLIGIIIVVYLVARRISYRIKGNFDSFTQKLATAVESGEMLNKSDFSIYDIKNAIDSINVIIYNKIIAERLLKENEVRFRTLFENVPVLITILDAHFNIRLGNKEMKSFCQNLNKNLINKQNLLDVLKSTNNLEKTKNDLEKFDGQFREFKIKTTNGIRTQNWASYKTEDNELIGVGYDISELKDNQQKLKDLNKTKDKFFSIISHDLQAPFNTIIGFADILLKKFDTLSKEKQLKYIDQIYKSSRGMHQLLLNLLNWARTQSGTIEVSEESFNIKEIVNNIFGILTPQAKKKAISLVDNINNELMVFADKSMTNTIIQNLVANGIKFTNIGGEIQINFELKENKILLSIKDNGVGIPKDKIPELFKLSSSKNQPGTNDESGTGLGLLICKEFIEKMGEKIWVESTEGLGTTFYFTVKIAK